MRLWQFRGNGNRVLVSLNPVVFGGSTLIILGSVIMALLYFDDVNASIKILQTDIANNFGWLFVLAVNVILAYLIFLSLTSYGAIRLGGESARPEYSYLSWFAMLFSAGMGIGLMFYSIAEPMYHLAEPPHGAEPFTVAAYQDAIKTTFLHWGLHAWGIYTLMGLGLAYFSYNFQLPMSVRSIFFPLLGKYIERWPGDVIDMLATVATLFGVSTSLGLGVTQINAGLNYLFDAPFNSSIQIVLITIITLIATVSVVLGVNKGIRRLSNMNMIIALFLLVFVFVIGPSLFIANGLVENTGLYLNDFFKLAFWNETYTQGDWQNGWTVFYWGWWIAWAPFVGMFIARVSKGRTIREFIGGVLFVSTILTFVWLTVFGNSALYIELQGPGGLANAVAESLPRSLFIFLEQLPEVMGIEIPSIVQLAVGVLACLIIISFFVTSSDSGSLVIDIITAGGEPNPPVLQRIYWALLEGVVAAILLVGGGLHALQTAAISSGLPFVLVMLIMIFSLHRGLRASQVVR